MTELQYALSVGVEVEYKVLKDSSIQASWHDGNCVEILTNAEFQELSGEKTEEQLLRENSTFGIQKTEEKKIERFSCKLALGHMEFENVKHSEFLSLVHTVMNDGTKYGSMNYSLRFETLEEAKDFANTLPKSWKAKPYTYHSYHEEHPKYHEVCFNTSFDDGIFENKSVQNRVNKMLDYMNKNYPM